MFVDFKDQPTSVAAISARPAKAALAARVQDLLPQLCPDSIRFRTAFLFLASRWTPNIDRLTAFSGCDRDFVARRARRWADHGLWISDPHGDAQVDEEVLLEAVRIGEGETVRPVADRWRVEGWTLTGDQSQVIPGLPVFETVDAEGAAAVDSDALLAALWARLDLTGPTSSTVRQAA